ncbi:surfactin synthase thioesterase subunit [Rhodococcus fascians]|uniref:thioesterase II family protein n=1 Tax=Nocardiaceae TaxID=85025 RepID=UPI0028661293|nr:MULTISPECIES: alpha/beta fold hydrolase [Rhodococcus]MDR6910101.1 surfactin synthase thioesterase subunit [Rhodococcus sp. 3258]MDR6931253.1 surfactin synthase thioesterase subunit [Rhodococcus fascians]
MTSESEHAPLTLVAFHHAGGSPAAFTNWRRHLGTDIRFIAVSLPGRKDLASYKRRDVENLLLDLDMQLRDKCAGPYVVYGHSMGATIGYAFAMYQGERHRRPPISLLVGAAAAPKSPTVLLGSTAVVDLVGAAINPDQQSDLGSVKQQQLVSDLYVLERVRTYCSSTFPRKASFPIRVFVGNQDPLPVMPAAWKLQTVGDVAVEEVAGDHFFHRIPKFVDRINQCCADLMAA